MSMCHEDSIIFFPSIRQTFLVFLCFVFLKSGLGRPHFSMRIDIFLPVAEFKKKKKS